MYLHMLRIVKYFCSKRYSGSGSLILLTSVTMKSVLQEFLCLVRDLNTANFFERVQRKPLHPIPHPLRTYSYGVVAASCTTRG